MCDDVGEVFLLTVIGGEVGVFDFSFYEDFAPFLEELLAGLCEFAPGLDGVPLSFFLGIALLVAPFFGCGESEGGFVFAVGSLCGFGVSAEVTDEENFVEHVGCSLWFEVKSHRVQGVLWLSWLCHLFPCGCVCEEIFLFVGIYVICVCVEKVKCVCQGVVSSLDGNGLNVKESTTPRLKPGACKSPRARSRACETAFGL